MGSDESHFNVSLIVMDKVTTETVSTNHNLSEEKGEPKRYRTEVLPLTSLTARPNRLAERFWLMRAFIWPYSSLSSRLAAVLLQVILNEWLALYSAVLISTKVVYSVTALFGCYMAGATWNCCLFGAFCVHHTTMHHCHVTSCKIRYGGYIRVQELCESRGGRLGFPVLMSLMVSVA